MKECKVNVRIILLLFGVVGFLFTTAGVAQDVQWRLDDWWVLEVEQRADWQMVPEPGWVPAGHFRFEVMSDTVVNRRPAWIVAVENFDDPGWAEHKKMKIYFDAETLVPVDALFAVDRAAIKGLAALKAIPFGIEGFSVGDSQNGVVGMFDDPRLKRMRYEHPKKGNVSAYSLRTEEYQKIFMRDELYYLFYECRGCNLPIRVMLVESSRW